MLLVALLACSSGDLDSATAPPWGELTVPDGPDVPVSGFVVAFTQDGGRIDGATYRMNASPSWGLQVTAGGMDPSEPGHGE